MSLAQALTCMALLVAAASAGNYGPPATSYGVPVTGFGGTGAGGGAFAGHAGSSSGFGRPTGFTLRATPASDSFGLPGGGGGGGCCSGSPFKPSGGGENEQPKAYQFGYEVRDHASGNDYQRHERSDGRTVQGEYRVALPDGRTQVVTYTADWKNGFQAKVMYEGEARYPPPPPGGYGAKPAFGAVGGGSGVATGHGNPYLNEGGSHQGARPTFAAYGPSGFHK